MGKKLTHEEFLERLDKKYPNRNYKILGKYKGMYEKILIESEFGLCLRRPIKMLSSENCDITTALDKTKYWVNQAIKVHGDKYDYSETNYINSKNKVVIICKKHGRFKQAPNNHLFGLGCKQCGSIERGLSKRYTTKDFIEKANKVHNNKYDYSLTEYNKSNEVLEVICKSHGSFYLTANKHLSHKQGCPDCLKEARGKSFIKKCSIKHQGRYDYSKVDYKNLKTIITVTCKKHGDFLIDPANHIYGTGCKKCDLEDKFEVFKSKSNEKHSDAFTYNKSSFKGIGEYVEITCKTHGTFRQVAYSHLTGCGCPKCKIQKHRDNPIGWLSSNWQKAAERSKHFDSYKVYIIRCWNDEEEFYKIGRTYTKIETRFVGKKMPYNYQIVGLFIFETAEEAFDIENELKREHKIYRYSPNIEFEGKSECFSKINIDID